MQGYRALKVADRKRKLDIEALQGSGNIEMNTLCDVLVSVKLGYERLELKFPLCHGILLYHLGLVTLFRGCCKNKMDKRRTKKIVLSPHCDERGDINEKNIHQLPVFTRRKVP